MEDEWQMAKKKKRPQGHYCKICGEYKANEKFSGKGHAAHICKSCSRLSAAEKAEMRTVNRLMGMSFQHLGQSEKKWLENRVHDSRPEVAELAKEVYRECFPYAERNAMKKQLVISELDFEIHTEVYQEYGDWEAVNQKFHIVRKERKVAFLNSDRGGPEQEAALDGGSMAKLLRWTLHTLEIFMWPQDYGYVSADGDPFMELNLDMGENVSDDDMDDEITWRMPGCFGNRTKKKWKGSRTGVCGLNIPMAWSRRFHVMMVDLLINRKNCIFVWWNILRRRKTADCLLLTLSCQTKRFQASKIKNLYGENFLLICI